MPGLGGLANAFQSGWQSEGDVIKQRHERTEALADEERKTKVASLYAQKGVLAKMLVGMKGKEDTPEYKSAADALAKIDLGITQAYHPIQNPGALQKDWHWLSGVMHRTKPTAPILSTTSVPPAGGAVPATSVAALTQPGQEITFPPSLPTDSQPVTPPAAPTAKKAAVKQPAPTRQERQQAQQWQQAKEQAALDIASAGLSLEQEEVAKATATVAGTRATVKALTDDWDAANPHASDDDRKNAHYDIWERVGLGVTGAYAGRTGKPDVQQMKLTDGTTTPAQWDPERRVWTYMNGAVIPSNLLGKGAGVEAKPVKKVRLGVVPSPQSETKYAVIWGDPYHPGNRSAWEWTEIGATRYQQIIQSNSTARDAYGVLTTTSRTTGPQAQGGVDLTGITHGSDLYRQSGESGAAEILEDAAPEAAAAPAPAPGAPAATRPAAKPAAPSVPGAPGPAPLKAPIVAARPTFPTTPQQAIEQAPNHNVATDPAKPYGTYENPLPLDPHGHVPFGARDAAGTPMSGSMRGAINRLLDGADIDKMGLGKDRGAVSDEASRYGWEQGLFNPQDKMRIRVATSFLQWARNSPSLSVFDDGTSRAKIAAALDATSKSPHLLGEIIAFKFDLTPDEFDAYQKINQLRGTISGLSALVRGGRTTEAGINRLTTELPNPMTTHSAEEAQTQLDRLLDEVDVAQKQGYVADVEGEGRQQHHPAEVLDQIFGPSSPAPSAPAAPPAARPAPPPPVAGQSSAEDAKKMQVGDIIRIGDKRYKYKGGLKSDLKNYEEVPNGAGH